MLTLILTSLVDGRELLTGVDGRELLTVVDGRELLTVVDFSFLPDCRLPPTDDVYQKSAGFYTQKF